MIFPIGTTLYPTDSTPTSRRLARPLARRGRKGERLRYARRAVELYPPLRLPDLAAAQGALQECEG